MRRNLDPRWTKHRRRLGTNHPRRRLWAKYRNLCRVTNQSHVRRMSYTNCLTLIVQTVGPRKTVLQVRHCARCRQPQHHLRQHHFRRNKNTIFLTQTAHWLEDGAHSVSDWQRVGVGQFTPSYLLDFFMDPNMIMTRVWGELCPRLLKMLKFTSPFLKKKLSRSTKLRL